MRKFTDQERAAIAREWAASGLPQDSYAASYGVTGRALRSWLAKFAPSEPPLSRVEAIIADAIAGLLAVLDALNALQEDRAEADVKPEDVMTRATAVVDDTHRQERRPEVAVDYDHVVAPEDRLELEAAAERGQHALSEFAPGEVRAVRRQHSGRGFFEDFR